MPMFTPDDALDMKEELNSDTIYEALKLDDKEIEEIDKEEKPDKKEKKDKDDDDEKLELEDDKEKDDDFKDDDLVVPPKLSDVLKKYPNLTKDFPFFSGALRREQEYTEMFGTVADAKEIIEKAKDYDDFSAGLLKGDLTEVLKTVKTNSEEAYGDLIDNILPTLSRVDNNAYTWMIGDVIRRSIISGVKEASNLGEDTEEGKQLKAACAIFHKFMFGNTNLVAPIKFGKGKGPENQEIKDERSKIAEERAEILIDRYEENFNTIDERVENTLRATVAEHIDTKSLMSPYVKRNAINDAIDKLDELIGEDTRFTAHLERLWQNAIENGFNSESMAKIKSAYLGKAKSLLPSVIRSTRAEALKNADTRDDERETRPRNRDVSDRVDESNKTNRSGSKSSKEYVKGMDTAEYLLSD